MAAMTLVGIGTVVGSPLAYAVESGSSNGDTVATEIERNNELDQEIKQSQEGCTNEVEGGLSGEAEQENNCIVTQDQTGANVGSIADLSSNEFESETFLANIGLSL